MIDLLKQAVEQAAQLPEDEQRHIAEMILAEIESDKRWEKLLSDPGSEAVLERMAEEAHQEYLAGKTRDLEELL